MVMTTSGGDRQPPLPAPTLLKVRGLSKWFGSVQAVCDLSFTVNRGEILAMLGPNGAGKTTTLKCIVGLLRPQWGEITIDGLPARKPRSRQVVGWVPEVPTVYELLTPWEHLQFVALAYGLDGPGHRGGRQGRAGDHSRPANWRAEAEKLLKRFDLWDKRDTLASSLSKGMRQKLLICTALLHHPSLLILDEPMVGLDPPAQRQLRELFLELRDSGVGLLISTHMLESVERICDRALIMHKGRRVAEGSLARLRDQFHLPTGTPLEDVFFEAIMNDGRVNPE